MNEKDKEQLLGGKEKKNSNIVQKVLVLVLLLFVVIGAVFIILNIKKVDKTNEINNNTNSSVLKQYEANVILDDPQTLQDEYDEMVRQAKEGQMALEMKPVATSEDGKKFICYLGNSKKNKYDMYMVLYLDDTQEEIYRTGLIPIGGRIESFELDKKLKPGDYTATISYNQVEEDGVTEHAQVNIGLDLVVQGK